MSLGQATLQITGDGADKMKKQLSNPEFANTVLYNKVNKVEKMLAT